MTTITDWPEYRAGKIAEWLEQLGRYQEQLKRTMEPGMRSDIEALIEALIMDIDNYESQQRTEGH
jgi:hypothetical protein